MKMSPFANADKIDAPLLLLHGAQVSFSTRYAACLIGLRCGPCAVQGQGPCAVQGPDPFSKVKPGT
jgi:hypothetical protein